MSKTFGIISLIFSIIGICCGWIIVFNIGFVFPAIAVIFGIIGIIKDDSKGMAISGLVIGIASVFIIIVFGNIFRELWYVFIFGGIPAFIG